MEEERAGEGRQERVYIRSEWGARKGRVDFMHRVLES